MLVDRGDQHTHDGREEGGQQDGDKHIRGLGSTHLGTIHKDRDWYQRQSAGVEHQEHNHGIRGGVLLRIDLLQLFHRLEAQWCGCIVKSQHIGGDIHEDTTCHGMTLGHVRKQTHEQRRQQSGQHIDHTTLLANLHHTQPERQYARQA